MHRSGGNAGRAGEGGTRVLVRAYYYIARDYTSSNIHTYVYFGADHAPFVHHDALSKFYSVLALEYGALQDPTAFVYLVGRSRHFDLAAFVARNARLQRSIGHRDQCLLHCPDRKIVPSTKNGCFLPVEHHIRQKLLAGITVVPTSLGLLFSLSPCLSSL